IVENNFASSNIRLNAPSLTRFNINANRLSNGSIIATLAGGSSFYWTISNNIIDNGQISINTLIVSQFRGNTINAILFGSGFLISNGGEHVIEGNTIDGAKNHGLVLTTAHSCVIANNRIRFYGA